VARSLGSKDSFKAKPEREAGPSNTNVRLNRQRILLISNPYGIHTSNWIDGLVSEGAEVNVLFVDRWAKRAGALRGSLDIDAVMLHTPSVSRLLGHSLT